MLWYQQEGPLESNGSKPCLDTAGHIGLCPLGFWVSPRVETSQSVPVFNHPYSKRSLFIMFKHNFLCFSLCPVLLVPSLGAMEKSLAVHSLLPPHQAVKGIDKILLSPLFPRLSSPASASAHVMNVPVLSSPLWPSLDLLQCVHILPVLGRFSASRFCNSSMGFASIPLCAVK